MTTPDLLRKVAEAAIEECAEKVDDESQGNWLRDRTFVDPGKIVERVLADHAEVLDAPDSDGPWLARLVERVWDGKGDRWQPVWADTHPNLGRLVFVAGNSSAWSLFDFDRWQRIVPPKEQT